MKEELKKLIDDIRVDIAHILTHELFGKPVPFAEGDDQFSRGRLEELQNILKRLVQIQDQKPTHTEPVAKVKLDDPPRGWGKCPHVEETGHHELYYDHDSGGSYCRRCGEQFQAETFKGQLGQ